MTTAILLAASASLFYYCNFTLPRMRAVEEDEEKLEQEKGEKKKQKEEASEEKKLLDACLQKAFSVYESTRQDSCKRLGLEASCNLPHRTEAILANYFDRLRDKCFKKHPTAGN